MGLVQKHIRYTNRINVKSIHTNEELCIPVCQVDCLQKNEKLFVFYNFTDIYMSVPSYYMLQLLLEILKNIKLRVYSFRKKD